MRAVTKKKAVSKKQTFAQKLSYVKKNWQLYLFFLMPASSFDNYFQIHSYEWGIDCI